MFEYENSSLKDFYNNEKRSSFFRNKKKLKKTKDWYKGVITPIQWDEFDRPIQYSLYMEADDEYVLRPLRSYLTLSEYLNKKVMIYGEMIDGDTIGFYKIKLAPELLVNKNTRKEKSSFSDEFEIFIPEDVRQYVM